MSFIWKNKKQVIPDSLLEIKENQNHLFLYMISYQLLVIRNRTLFNLDLSVQQLNDGFFKVVSTFFIYSTDDANLISILDFFYKKMLEFKIIL